MRLIDADAFEKAMYHRAFETDSDYQKWDSGCWIRYKMVEEELEHAPTIDATPERHGSWIPLGYRSGFLKNPDSEDFKCSICGYEAYTLYFPPPKRCPSCGAKMDGEE